MVFPDTIAVTGCAVVDGDLYFGSFDGRLWRLPAAQQDTGDVEEIARLDAGVTDVALGPDGLLYIATNDAILRMAPIAAGVRARPRPYRRPRRLHRRPSQRPKETATTRRPERGSRSPRSGRWRSGWGCGSRQDGGCAEKASPRSPEPGPDESDEPWSSFQTLSAPEWPTW